MIDSIICPGFLLADPQLTDEIFHRSVVGLIHSDPQGAFGLVLNKSTNLTLNHIFPEAMNKTLGLSLIYQGGPVEPERLFVIHDGSNSIPQSEFAVPLTKDMVFEPHFATIEQWVYSDFPGILRCYLGYAGWDKGQLEQECKEGSWFTSEANSSIWANNPGTSMWMEAMKVKSQYHGMIAQTGYRPSLN